jgi:hypothetical protein
MNLPEKSLVVFVDDTGHEALVAGHPVYGLGGCAVMTHDLDRVICQPWHEVRRKVTGSADTPLHAASFGRTATEEQIRIVADFFRTQPFARLGAIISVKTRLTGDLGTVDTIAGVLKNRIVDIAKWTRFTEVHVIFESSERANRHIEAAFGDFRIEENGKAMPVECYFMPKDAADPSLEVADFIMHAIGRQARRQVEGKQGFAPDFAAVFHRIDPKLVSFMQIDEVKKTPREPSMKDERPTMAESQK